MNGRDPGEGERVGRSVVFRDDDGRLVAVTAGSVTAVCETDDGGVLMQVGGRLVPVDRCIGTVLAWLDGQRP